MAGPAPAGFNAARVREGIRRAMRMGSPNQTADKATFVFSRDVDVDGPVDPVGVPYDVAEPAVADTTPDDIVKDVVAVELGGPGGRETSFGRLEENEAVLTIFDEDYADVATAVAVRLGGDLYHIDSKEVVAMFDIDVYQLRLTAQDET